ncbi:translation initiation protein Sua5 [Ascosphaera apis ARSEF 7405]|uniref:Threonylcarbamoyl-AMP synthase n=1 Tax=Ascosphaera apis ARSEF 7405 TaxID=392613 RepID=A0A168CY48_9EURO|nr:translation initiation protein Sua5 [Ascosphaera apis ARSEF 7405]
MAQNSSSRRTRILSVRKLNTPLPNNDPNTDEYLAARWNDEVRRNSPEALILQEAAEALRNTNTPVAFPTETVYGLAADATRSEAVRGIYAAKQRPSDNPLIVHVSSRHQLLRLLNQSQNADIAIPDIYEPLISRFWPGPLTIILPIPSPSPLAKEVTSTLQTFGVRMPSSPLARLLIYAADRPLAAPSANASTKPSPTTAHHVFTDMDGRIDIILDGGPCGVGVESTVVDGLSHPPAILRPGGIGIREIQSVPGWENVEIGYKDKALTADDSAPRAPGMKYKHYSPKAKVVLFRAGTSTDTVIERLRADAQDKNANKFDTGPVGIVRTTNWPEGLSLPLIRLREQRRGDVQQTTESVDVGDMLTIRHLSTDPIQDLHTLPKILDINIGTTTESIARNLFYALRALDEENASVIYVEGISDTDGDLAQAIMNRLRKAAEEEVK